MSTYRFINFNFFLLLLFLYYFYSRRVQSWRIVIIAVDHVHVSAHGYWINGTPPEWILLRKVKRMRVNWCEDRCGLSPTNGGQYIATRKEHENDISNRLSIILIDRNYYKKIELKWWMAHWMPASAVWKNAADNNTNGLNVTEWINLVVNS